MTDYPWPDDLPPYTLSFYLQPHTGGQESPFSRVGKFYGLAAPRFVCSMSFRGGYWGTDGQAAFGPRLDAMIAKLRGRLNRAAIYDFKRFQPRAALWPAGVGNSAAILGATTMVLTGLPPGTPVFAGDYIGGDGRPHVITDDTAGDSSGNATVTFYPPLKAAVGLNAAIFTKVTGLFRLTDDDAGANSVEVGQAQTMTLNFVEDL